MKFQFAIDRGGTFTDVFARCPDGRVRVAKLLSVDPQNYEDAPREGIRRIMEEVTGRTIPKDSPIDAKDIKWIRMGTTVATNALLERKGERSALVVTKGFKDLIFIGKVPEECGGFFLGHIVSQCNSSMGTPALLILLRENEQLPFLHSLASVLQFYEQ